MSDSVIYEYDEVGRLKKLTFDDTTEVVIEYDDMGNRVEVETTIPEP